MSLWITAVGSDCATLEERHIQDTLSLWAKELFVEQYPYKVDIYICEDSISCTFRHNTYPDRVDLSLPARLLGHDFIFSALWMPFGNYRLREDGVWETRGE